MIALAIQHGFNSIADSGENGWIELLVFVIFAVIYAIGGLIKAKGSKFQKSDDDALEQKLAEYSRRKPRPKPEQTQRRMSQQAQRQARQPAAVSVASAAQDQRTRSQIKLDEMTVEATRPKTDSIYTPQAQVVEPAQGVNIMEDLQALDGLERAVLFYEIFGKPVSLRENPPGSLS